MSALPAVPPADDQSSPEQRAAIDHDGGPCLVVAVPGSGKTWAITQRFIRLIREGVPPEQILALTYNRRAADEMLARVEAEVGPLTGEPPPLTTYNSWAASLVRDWGHLLGPGYKNVSIASGTEQFLFLAEAIAEVAPPELHNPARPHDQVAPVGRVIQRAKQELVTPEQYRRVAREMLRTAAPEDLEEAHRQIAVANVYTRLQEKYQAASLIDHDDCIQLATELIRRFPVVRRACAQYRYVMVDEYQDTNTAQAEMVERMVGSRANLLVVADDDQAIYRFRGASRENIRRFQRTFPQAKQLTLPHNRRSTPEIVAAAQDILDGAGDRQAKIAFPVRMSGDRVRVIAADHYNDEAAAIVATIASKLKAGARPRDVAVLFRNHGDMDATVLALQSAGIPYVSRGGADYFRAPEVLSMVRLLEAVANPDENQAVLGCLTLGAWRMSVEGRFRVVRQLLVDDTPLIDLLALGTIAELSDQDIRAGQTLARDIRELAVASQQRDIRDIFERGIQLSQRFGIDGLHREIERQQFSRNVMRMREIISEFCDARSPHLHDAMDRNGQLVELVDYLRLMRRSGTESLAPLDDSVDGVRLSTIHGAKGLEWNHVIMAGCVDGKLPARRRPDGLDLPEVFLPTGREPAAAQLDEELRLFYVGATRARDSLTFTWAKRYAGNRDSTERKPSRFLNLIESSDLDQEHQMATEIAAGKPRITVEPTPDPELRLSFSALEAFKRCERQYEYRSVWGVPQVSSPDARFGTMVHAVMCDAMRLRTQGQKVDTKLALRLWETRWRNEGRALKVQHKELYARGVRMIKNYVATPHFQDADIYRIQVRDAQGRPVGAPRPMIEFPFRIDMGDNVTLVGRFDRVDCRDGKPVVVDYKTGAPKSQASLQRSEQLRLYAAAIADLTGVTEVTCEIHWLQNGTVSQVTFNKQQLEVARKSAIRWSARIREQHNSTKTLPTNSNSWNCGDCPYRLVCDQGRDVGGTCLGGA